MAKNIHPIEGQDYIIVTPENDIASFKVTHIGPKIVYVEWGEVGRNKGWVSDFYYDDFSNQENQSFYHIFELKSPEEILIYQLKYAK